jgi:hypothetical protein
MASAKPVFMTVNIFNTPAREPLVNVSAEFREKVLKQLAQFMGALCDSHHKFFFFKCR